MTSNTTLKASIIATTRPRNRHNSKHKHMMPLFLNLPLMQVNTISAPTMAANRRAFIQSNQLSHTRK